MTWYGSSDMEVRRKAVNIALSMVTSRNVQEVVLFLKKQLTKTLEQEHEKVARLMGTLVCGC
jgi:coatomer subunit beta